MHAEDVVAAEQALGVTIGEGDAVLLRSGHFRRREELGAWDPDTASAGFHVDAVPLLAERGIALLGGDGDSDVRPSPVEGVHSPVHALAVTAMGVPLLDNLDLEALSAATRRGGAVRVPARRGAAERPGRNGLARQPGRGPVTDGRGSVAVRGESNLAWYHCRVVADNRYCRREDFGHKC